MTKEEIIELVQNKLDAHKQPTYGLQVVPTSVRHTDDDWWVVGVRPDGPVARRYDYYDIMAQVSREIEDEEKANVTLVPPPSGTK